MERKVALITGGAKGIGRQIALSLAENGHDIAVNYHSDKNSADEICKTAKENGVNALSFYANMGNVDEIKNMVFQVDQKFGKIDVLINNAGISSEVYFLDATEYPKKPRKSLLYQRFSSLKRRVLHHNYTICERALM